MKATRWTAWTAAVALMMTAAGAGCQGMNHTQNGALVGTGVGALGGALIGQHNGHTGRGAALGALAGGVGGALLGNAQDSRDERDAAIAQAHYSEQQRQAAATALTNADLVRMAQSGVGDEVIVQSVRSRGGSFDLRPDAIIALKQSGVSDRVLVEIQKAGEAPPRTVVSPGATYVAGPPHVVVVRPQPAVRFGVMVGGRRPHRRPWRRGRRNVYVHHHW